MNETNQIFSLNDLGVPLTFRSHKPTHVRVALSAILLTLLASWDVARNVPTYHHRRCYALRGVAPIANATGIGKGKAKLFEIPRYAAHDNFV